MVIIMKFKELIIDYLLYKIKEDNISQEEKLL